MQLDREFVTQMFVAIAVCVGGWMVFVQPKAAELQQLERTIRQERSKTGLVDIASVEQVARQAPHVRKRADEIKSRGALAQDSSMLYGKIMDLAKQHDVQVKNLRPGAERQRGDKENPMTVVRIDMTAEGEYDKVARFLDAVQDSGAYLRTVAVQIAPTKRTDGAYTVMQLGFEAIRFSLPKVLKEIRGASS